MATDISNEIAVVSSWEEFRERWAGGPRRQNFLLRGEIFPHHFDSPPLEEVVAEVRQHGESRSLRGGDDSAVKPPSYPEFIDLPIEDAVQAKILLAHFESRAFAGPGHVFEGLNEIFDAWYADLARHGFTHQSTQRAFFLSGPNCHTNYHFDSSYVLAWQILGRKRFCWLKDPEKWCTPEIRFTDAGNYDRMFRPGGISPDDVIECEMGPGDVLWNIMLTPHWVYSLDEASYSFNLTHFKLQCDGQFSDIDNELVDIHGRRWAAQQSNEPDKSKA